MKTKNKNKLKNDKRMSIAIVFIAVFLLLFIFMFVRSPDVGITGRVVRGDLEVSRTSFFELDKYVTQTSAVPLSIKLNQTELKSLAVSGSFIGDGKFKIYLVSSTDKILVADSDDIRKSVAPELGLEVSDEEYFLEDNPVNGNGTLEIKLELGDDPKFDPENDAVEHTSSVIDFTVANSSVPRDESLLCTRWTINGELSTCFGNEACCNFIDLPSVRPEWNASYHLHAGIEGVGKTNIVSARIINFDLENNVTYSNEKLLLAKFYTEKYSFFDYCEDSCFMEGFGEDYDLLIEIDRDMYLTLGNVTYSGSGNVSVLAEVEEIMPDFPEIVLEKQEDWSGDYILLDNYDGTFDLEIFTGERVSYDVMFGAQTVSTVSKAKIKDINKSQKKTFTTRIDESSEEGIVTEVVAVKEIFEFKEANITLRKIAPVEYIVRCDEFNVTTFGCDGEWQSTNISFKDDSDTVTFTVTHFSAYAGSADLTVINLHSYPPLGGNWTVMFNTTGRANLSITGTNGTSFGTDLQFLELKCGDTILNSTFNGTTVFYENYECNETGYEISKELTTGAHTLQFTFGNDTEYAYNYVATDEMILNSTALNYTTTDNLTCYARGNSSNVTITAYWQWVKDGALILSGNTTIPNNTMSLITTIGSGNTTAGDNWTCSVKMNNGTDNESAWNNASQVIGSICGETWLTNTTYYLTTNITTAGTCWSGVHTAGGASLDCQGHSITGGVRGIYDVTSSTDQSLTVRNCIFQGFTSEAVTIKMDPLVFNNNTFRDMTGMGLNLNGGWTNWAAKIYNNTFINISGTYGLIVTGYTDSTQNKGGSYIADNVFIDINASTADMHVSSGYTMNVYGNTFNNSNSPTTMRVSLSNVLYLSKAYDNVIYNSSGGAFIVGKWTQFFNNSVYTAGGTGLNLTTADSANISNTILHNISGYGIYIDSDTSGAIIYSTDIRQDNQTKEVVYFEDEDAFNNGIGPTNTYIRNGTTYNLSFYYQDCDGVVVENNTYTDSNISNIAVMGFSNCSGVQVKNNAFSGDGEIFYFIGVENSTISGNTYDNVGSFSTAKIIYTIWTDNVIIENNIIASSTDNGYGYGFYDEYSNNLTIYNNTLNTPGFSPTYCIYMRYGSGYHISNNNCRPSNIGALLSAISNSTFNSNYIEYAENRGMILSDGTNNVTVINNTIYRWAGNDAIYENKGEDNKFINNTAFGGWWGSVFESQAGSNRTLIQGNNFSSYASNSQQVYLGNFATNFTIIDNFIGLTNTNAPGTVLLHVGGTGHNISGNIFSRAQNDAVSIDASNVIFHNNTIDKAGTGAGDNAIEVTGTNINITNNIINQSYGSGIYFTQNITLLTGNTIYDTEYALHPSTNSLTIGNTSGNTICWNDYAFHSNVVMENINFTDNYFCIDALYPDEGDIIYAFNTGDATPIASFNASNLFNYTDTNCTLLFDGVESGDNNSLGIDNSNQTIQSNQTLVRGTHTMNVSCQGINNSKTIQNEITFQILSTYATNLECELDSSGTFENCSNSTFGRNITRVRGNCTDIYSVETMSNATFELINLYDNQTFISGISTTQSGGYYVLDNSDVYVQDSGDWSIKLICTDTEGVQLNLTENYNLPFGNVTNTALIVPSGNYDVVEDSTFSVTCRTQCTGGECINTSVTLDPQIENSTYEFLECTVPPSEMSTPSYSTSPGDILNGSWYSQTDDGGFIYELPWIFPLVGVNYTNVTFDSNVVLQLYPPGTDLDNSFSVDNGWTLHDDGDYITHGDNGTYIWIASTDFKPNEAESGQFTVCNESDHVIFTWNGTSYGDKGKSDRYSEFQVVIYETGTIRWNFKNFSYVDNDPDEYTGISYYNSSSASYVELSINDTLTAPSSNFSYEYLIILSPTVINDLDVSLSPVGKGTSMTCLANVTSNLNLTISNVNFSITLPDATTVFIGDGTQDGDIWTSPTYIPDEIGTYSCVVNAIDNESNIGTSTQLFTTGTKGAIPMNAGSPFYTTSQNPRYLQNQSCLLSMVPGENCDTSWDVVTNSTVGETWEFFCEYDGLYVDPTTNKINVTITSVPDAGVISQIPTSEGTGGGGEGFDAKYSSYAELLKARLPKEPQAQQPKAPTPKTVKDIPEEPQKPEQLPIEEEELPKLLSIILPILLLGTIFSLIVYYEVSMSQLRK